MHDLTYAAALEQAAARPRALMGPAPCQGCGAWVEWAGAAWINAGTEAGEPHSCAPFSAERPIVEIVAEWTRPTTGLAPVRMAHPEPAPLPGWVRGLGLGLLWVACLLAAASAGAWVARQLAG